MPVTAVIGNDAAALPLTPGWSRSEKERSTSRSPLQDAMAGGIRGYRPRADGMRVGIAHHLGWAVAVTASTDYKVADRRRIELIELGMATAPIHHEGKPLDDAATAALVVKVRAPYLASKHRLIAGDASLTPATGFDLS